MPNCERGKASNPYQAPKLQVGGALGRLCPSRPRAQQGVLGTTGVPSTAFLPISLEPQGSAHIAPTLGRDQSSTPSAYLWHCYLS